MTRETLNIKIDTIGVDTCTMVISKMFRGQKINGSKLSKIISDVCNINELTFENDKTESMIDSLVRNWIFSNMNGLHKMIFQQVGMNQNGNWITDQNKWA
jgi:hypothetical protein